MRVARIHVPAVPVRIQRRHPNLCISLPQLPVLQVVVPRRQITPVNKIQRTLVLPKLQLLLYLLLFVRLRPAGLEQLPFFLCIGSGPVGLNGLVFVLLDDVVGEAFLDGGHAGVLEAGVEVEEGADVVGDVVLGGHFGVEELEVFELEVYKFVELGVVGYEG